MRVARKLSGPVLGIFSLSFMMALAGCGSTTPATLAPLTVTPGATTVVVPQDGTPATLAVTISPLNSTVTVTVSGVPLLAPALVVVLGGALCVVFCATTVSGVMVWDCVLDGVSDALCAKAGKTAMQIAAVAAPANNFCRNINKLRNERFARYRRMKGVCAWNRGRTPIKF